MITTWIGIAAVCLLNIIGWWLADRRNTKREAEKWGRYAEKVDRISNQINGTLTNHISCLERRIARIEFAMGLEPEDGEHI